MSQDKWLAVDPKIRAEITAMVRAGEMNISKIQRVHNVVSTDVIKRALVPKWREMRNKKAKETRSYLVGYGGFVNVTDRDAWESAKHRLKEIPEDTRSLTGYLCGDPLPGRSALDRRQSHI